MQTDILPEGKHGLHRLGDAAQHSHGGSTHMHAREDGNNGSEYLVNIVSGRRTAQKRVTGRRWRRIVLADVLAEHVVRDLKE